jgi:hypothetical protein
MLHHARAINQDNGIQGLHTCSASFVNTYSCACGGELLQDANTAPGPFIANTTSGQVEYNITVTNTGNVDLVVTLSDNRVSLGTLANVGTLAPNAS